MEPRRERRAKCRSSRRIQRRRISCPWRLGVVDDLHDLRQLGGQVYARLLLLDIVVLRRGIPGLAALMFFDREGLQNNVDVLPRRAMSALLLKSSSASSTPWLLLCGVLS